MSNDNNTADQYFATLPAEELGPELKTRIEDYFLYVQNWGIYDTWANSYQKYYVSQMSAGSLTNTGEQGEYTLLKINHYRNIIQNILVMTTKESAAFDCIPTNDDHESMAQAEIGDTLLEYYRKEKSLNKYFKQACEYALWAGEGFLTIEWDVTGDQQYSKDPVTGAPIKEGDLRFMAYAPLDVIRDYHAYSPEYAKNWHIVRQWKNKWDLIAKFPDQKDDILAVSEETQSWLRYDTLNSRFNIHDADLIPYYVFFHRPTDALPKGRITEFVSDDCILYDGPLPYNKDPVYRIAASNLEGTIFGYSIAYDLMPIQEALDNLNSVIMTNQLTYGVQNILLPVGSNITANSFVKGLNAITYNPKLGEPKALQLTATPVEIFNFAKDLVGEMQLISGINSVVRGNPEASLKSGSALALVQSQAIEFNSGLQEAYVQLMEAAGGAIIDILRQYASVPKIAAIAGKSKLALMPEFKADDLANINRVTVDEGNALAQTIAGRENIAKDLLQNKLVTTPQEYLEVLETGRLDPLIEGPNAELLLIRNENELLAVGDPKKQVMATMWDDHALHVKEHKVIQSSVQARTNPALMTALTAHMQQHMNLMKELDPTLAFLLGEQPAPQAAPPQGGMPAGAPGAPPNPAALGNIAANNNAQPLPQQLAGKIQAPNLPNMPAPLVQGQQIPENPNKIEAVNKK